MRATALIAAAALVCGTAAFAQQSTDHTTRHEDKARAEHQAHKTGDKLSNGMHRLGDKIRHGVHRLGDKLHAKNDRRDDTRAMGASGENHSRQSRMDSAYADWRSKHDRDERR